MAWLGDTWLGETWIARTWRKLLFLLRRSQLIVILSKRCACMRN